MEIETDNSIVAPQVKNKGFNSLVYRYQGLRNDQVIMYGRHYEILK